MTLSSNRRLLSRAKMLGFLDELEKATPDGARSLYLPPGLSPAEIEAALKKIADPKEMPPDLAEHASSSRTGAALFWSPVKRVLVLPPFPVPEQVTVPGFVVAPLHILLRHNYRIALILVRLGAYAVGICDGETLTSSKVGTGLVHGRHRQGGSSQARFRRHREKQIEYFLTRVCQHAREQFEPYARTLDYFVYGGAWTTILLLKKQCSFLTQFEERALPPLLDIPEPRRAVLTTAISRVWSSTVLEWND